MDEDARQKIALFRIAVLGPLVGARLEHGDLVELCREAATRAWELPSGEVVEVSARTVEDWHRAYQRGGFAALHPKDRSDKDKTRVISEELVELILRLKREKPLRSVKRIIRVLERAKKVPRGALTKSTVHRLLQVHGASRLPVRGPDAERRSFLVNPRPSPSPAQFAARSAAGRARATAPGLLQGPRRPAGRRTGAAG